MTLKILQNNSTRFAGNLRGVAWMRVAMLALAGLSVMIKLVGRAVAR